jgi:hypothetical protein
MAEDRAHDPRRAPSIDNESSDNGGFDAVSFFTKENQPHMVRKESTDAEGHHTWMELPDGRKSPRITRKN